MADPFAPSVPGVSVSPYPVDLQQQAAALSRRRALADALLARSLQPAQQATGPGGMPVPTSIFAHLAPLANLLAASVMGRGVDKGQADLAGTYQTGLDSALKQVTDQMKSGDYAGASQTAGRWPAMKTIQEKLLERQLPQNVLHNTYGPQGEQPSIVDLHNPSAPPAPVGGVKPQPLHPVETASPTGEPQTSFVDLTKPQEPMAKPVRKLFENTGGEIVPVNPYTQTEPLPKTLDPNRVGSPEDIDAAANLIATYKLAPPSAQGVRGVNGAAIMRRVAEINPQYDAKIFNTAKIAEHDFASGKQGNTIRSFNVALNHLDALDKAGANLNNVSFRPGNQLYNYVTEQLGQPAPTEFSAIKKIVGDEIVKAIIGSGGGVTDREEASATISRANSPEQLQGVIKKYKDLMSGQLGGLRQQYIASTGKNDFDKFLTPEGLSAAGRPSRRASDQPGGVIDFNSLPK